MPKIALKVNSAIELLIINYYHRSCRTTKMQTENKQKRHWKNEAESKRRSGAEHEGAGKQESGARAGRALRPMQEEQIN